MKSKDKKLRTFRLENGTLVTAKEEIYKAYASNRNKERYLQRKRNQHILKSLDDELVQNVAVTDNIDEEIDRLFEVEDLRKAIKKLSASEQQLILDYFFQDTSLRKLSKKYDVSHTKLHDMIHEVLDKLREYIINNFN